MAGKYCIEVNKKNAGVKHQTKSVHKSKNFNVIIQELFFLLINFISAIRTFV